MHFDKNKIIKFFDYFGKKILDKDIDILLGNNKGDLSRNFVSKNLFYKVLKYKFIFDISPFVKEIFVCNNIAFGCANEDSDIDIFVVCENNKIWITRLILTSLIHIFGIRRYGNNISGRFCLSFWSTDSGAKNLNQIQIEDNKDPYLALWTATLIPILNTGYLNKFKKENSWINNYGLSFVYNNLDEKEYQKDFMKMIFEKLFENEFFENFAKKILKKRCLKKREKLVNKYGTIISDEILKFHDNDIRYEIKKLC